MIGHGVLRARVATDVGGVFGGCVERVSGLGVLATAFLFIYQWAIPRI